MFFSNKLDLLSLQTGVVFLFCAKERFLQIQSCLESLRMQFFDIMKNKTFANCLEIRKMSHFRDGWKHSVTEWTAHVDISRSACVLPPVQPPPMAQAINILWLQVFVNCVDPGKLLVDITQFVIKNLHLLIGSWQFVLVKDDKETICVSNESCPRPVVLNFSCHKLFGKMHACVWLLRNEHGGFTGTAFKSLNCLDSTLLQIYGNKDVTYAWKCRWTKTAATFCSLLNELR